MFHYSLALVPPRTSSWTDDEVIEWDGNFRDGGAVLLTCSERATSSPLVLCHA